MSGSQMKQNGEHVPKEVSAILDALHLTDEVQHELIAVCQRSFDLGLQPETHEDAAVKMLISHVRLMPNGTERGNYLALDMGGTNFRVLLTKFTSEGIEVAAVEKYHLPHDVRTGTSDQFFDYIADKLDLFIKTHFAKCDSVTFPLGFTFSFPMEQRRLDSADLLIWTKDFAVDGVVGKDVVALLQKAIVKKRLKLRTVALLNDTVGVLMAGAYYDNDCKIGLIVGTGCNAAYVAPLSEVTRWTGDNDEPQQVVIDTECGAFGDDGSLDFMRAEFDFDLDSRTLNKRNQIYEKMFSGKYMGEVARLILIKLAQQGVLFEGEVPDTLQQQWVFTTLFVSEIVEGDSGVQHSQSQRILKSMGVDNPSTVDCKLVYKICCKLTERGAILVAAAIAALLIRVKKSPVCGIGVDGSLYNEFPTFRNTMVKKLEELSPEYKARFLAVDDGSGIGAAVVAATVSGQSNK
ncbi:hexokinase-4-like [Asterias amurensis]|uniref:hexokinase-4-like n=1 Tax=Asterias amurensis TaxID=7602 RepID=UPI003AB5395D